MAQIGEKLATGSLTEMTADGPAKVETADLFAGKKVVLFGVPGAFTPTCHANHLPGFLDNIDTFSGKGVDLVGVISVNDVHVMNHWAKATGGEGKIRYFSDGNGEFVTAAGLDIDLSIAGMGVRSKRFSMLVNDGTVELLNIEPNPGQADETSAATLLSQM
ncbi:MAG: peroxiredoxin [Pseudomonadota bacterium]